MKEKVGGGSSMKEERRSEKEKGKREGARVSWNGGGTAEKRGGGVRNGEKKLVRSGENGKEYLCTEEREWHRYVQCRHTKIGDEWSAREMFIRP